MRNLSLKQLRTIQEIASLGKINSAANALSLTAPAITIQLKQAEREIGMALFDRTQDGMRPTAAGLAVIDAAQSVQERLRVLADEIDAIRGVRAGTLKLGVVSTAKYFAPRLMAAFAKAHPGVDMKLSIGNRAEINDMLRDHAVDVALMGRAPRNLPLHSAPFGDHPLVIVAAPDHPLAQTHDISKQRIAEETFLIREPGSGTRISLEIFFSDVPGRIEELGVEMGSNETIKQAVMAGLGVAFISAHTIAMEVEFGRLIVLDVAGMPIRRQWFGVMRSDRAISPAMATFNDFLMRQGAAYLPLLGRLYPDPIR